MADHKREATFQDEDSSRKKSKVTDVYIGIENKSDIEDCSKSNTASCIMLVSNQSISNEINGKKEENLDEKLSMDCNSNPQVVRTHNSSEDTSSHNSVDSVQQISRATCLEADAAENKGSRHTMEDAWVVLLDASLETPGTLRCAHFAIYDGHGGRMAAEYGQRHLHKNVIAAGLPHGYQGG